MFALTVLRSGISRLKLSRASSICGQEPIMADKNFQTLPFTLRGTCRRLTCRGSDHLYTRRLAFYAERRTGFPIGREENGYLHERLVSRERQDLFLTRGKGLDPKAEHAHLCVCGGLDWAGERLRREVAHHNRESTRLREVTIAAVSGDRDTHRSTSISFT